MSCNTNPDITSHLSAHDVKTPELFLPNIVTDLQLPEFGMTLSPIDAKTIFFTRRLNDSAKQKIYVTKYIDHQWSAPVIASFSTD